ncbi:hypothetical protein [Prevotella communis]|uniref:hypothetical protein n=1 Tax=Prevotella communis TaxID=2913614 RepID=UPI001EDA1708|nr:hypothetical protein [Prevotella communis]UKK55428.1 hypothetical protein L6476_08035 [Prevotella communis]
MAAFHDATGTVIADDTAHIFMVFIHDVGRHRAVLYRAIVIAADAAHVISLGIDVANHVDVEHLAVLMNGGEQSLILFVEATYHVGDGVAVAPERAAVPGDPVGLAAQGHPRVGVAHVDVGVQVVVQLTPVVILYGELGVLVEVLRDVRQFGSRVDDHDIALLAIRGVERRLRLRRIIVGVGPRARDCRQQQGEDE